MKIGIDLDNTIIFYDDAFVRAAIERKLLPAGFKGTKQQVRDAIRKREGGETEWQKLQGYVYGKGLAYASLFPGFEDFLKTGKRAGAELYIVSHKTELGHFDPDRVNLRNAARDLLKHRNVFSVIPEHHLFFADTRGEKVDRIAALSPDWFIDDLVEVYEEPHFPASIRKILFHTAPDAAPAGDWKTCAGWHAVTQAIFG